MRTSTVFAATLSLIITVQARAQTRHAQVDEIRQQIDALQRKLSNLESAQDSPAQKVTQLGASRHLRGEPTMVVRVYDLSDLFSIAPAYAAAIGNDLGLPSRVMFPEAVMTVAGGSTGAGMSGGMGMGGMGGG